MNTNQKSHQLPIGDSLTTEVGSSPQLISVNYFDITMNQPDTATDFASIPAPIRALTEASTASREKPALSPAPIKTLTDKHRQEICVDSCVNAVQATAFESVSDPERIKVYLNNPMSTHKSGWIAHGVDPATGNNDPETGCFKPDVPRLDDKGKLIKYENRRKLDSTTNTPPIFLRQPDEDYWLKVMNDPSEPLCLAEGAKKAASIMSNYPLATVALRGVNCYTDKKGSKDDDTKLHPSILEFKLAGRLVYVAYDADCLTKPNVARALSTLERLLSDQGAIVKILVLDGLRGKGIDDFIKNGGVISDLIRNAKMANQLNLPALFPTQPVDWTKDDLLETAVFKAFKRQHGDNYLLDSETETFYERNGVELSKVKDSLVKKLIHELMKKVRVKTTADDGTVIYQIKSFNSTRKVDNCFTYLQTELRGESTFKDDINRLAFTNGVLDLRTMELAPYKHDDLFLVNFPYPYHPQNECPPAFLKFLKTSFGEDQVEKIRAIIRYLLDSTFWDYFIHVMGEAGSGKGTLLNIIAALFPDSAVVHTNNLGIITQEDKRYQYLPRGSRLLKVDDCPGFNQAPQDMYSLIENNKLTARKLYSSDAAIGINFNIKFLLASIGAIITSSDGKDGWARRVLMIKTLPIQQQTRSEKKQYKGDIEAEVLPYIAGIAGWALAMTKDEMKAQTELVLKGELNRELQIIQDPASQFTEVALTRTTSSIELWESYILECYKAWAKSLGIKTGVNKFRDSLRLLLRNYFVPPQYIWEPGKNGKAGRTVKVKAHYKGVALVNEAFHIGKDPFSELPTYHFNPEKASFGGLADLLETPIELVPVELDQTDQPDTKTDTTLPTQKLTDKQLALLARVKERNSKMTWEVERDAKTLRQIANHPEWFDLSTFH